VLPIASSSPSQTQSIHIVGTAQYPNRPYPANPQLSDIAVNGGLESGTSPWQVITSGSTYLGTISQSSDAHSGVASGSFRITSNPATGGYLALSESVSANVGESYVLSFYYKSTLGSFSAYVFCKDTQTLVGHDLAYWSTGSLSSTDLWTLETLAFGPIPSGTVDTQIHFDSPNGVTGTLQLDDITAQNVSVAITLPTSTTQSTPTPTTSPQQTSTPSTSPTSTPTSASTQPPGSTSNPSTTPTTPSSSTPNSTLNPTATATSTYQPITPVNPPSSPTTTATLQPTAPPAVPEFPVALLVFLVIVVLTLGLALVRGRLRSSRVWAALGKMAAVALLLSLIALSFVAAQTAPNPTPQSAVDFSLWYTSDLHTGNGTVFPSTISNLRLVVVDVNNWGAPPVYPGVNEVFVLRNDGNTAINVSLTCVNVNFPGNLRMDFEYRNYFGGSWPISVGVGQSVTLWFIPIVYPTSVYTPSSTFNYSFDIVVTATQA
jgi:hypothetical protein